MARTVLTKGLVFDGTGTPPVPGEVTLADDRVLSVTPGYRDDHGTDRGPAASTGNVQVSWIMTGGCGWVRR